MTQTLRVVSFLFYFFFRAFALDTLVLHWFLVFETFVRMENHTFLLLKTIGPDVSTLLHQSLHITQQETALLHLVFAFLPWSHFILSFHVHFTLITNCVFIDRIFSSFAIIVLMVSVFLKIPSLTLINFESFLAVVDNLIDTKNPKFQFSEYLMSD